MPKPAHFNNNKSAITHLDFVSEPIQDLLKTNRIIKVNDLSDVVNPLSVTVQNSGKKRLILDLRYVNKHIYKERIKFEDLRLMEQFLNLHDSCLSLTSNKAIIILTFINHIKNSLVFHERLGEELVILYLLSSRLD